MNKEILRLSIPNIISNISVPLLSTVDTALMGRFSELHIGAVGIGAMIFNFIYWNFGFLRMGTTGMTAQAYGKKNQTQIMTTLAQALFVVVGLATLILLLQVPFGQLTFNLMNISAEQSDFVNTYFYIRIWAAPATLALYAFMGWFFGMQNAIYPLLLTVSINIVNIVFSFLFIYQFDMDVAGVAYSTVIAQYFGLFVAILLFRYKYSEYFKYYKQKAVFEIVAMKKFFVINRDIFIRTFCLTFVFGFFYSQSSLYGKTILAVNVILLQFINWMSYGIDGFAFASESLVGKYAGAKDTKNLKKAILYSFCWGLVLALLFSFVYGFFGHELLHVFTDKENIIDATIPYLPWLVLFPVLAFACYIWDGVFIGLTASVAMRNSMLLSLGFFLFFFYLFQHQMNNHGLWLSLLVFMVMRGIIQTIMYWRKGFELS